MDQMIHLYKQDIQKGLDMDPYYKNALCSLRPNCDVKTIVETAMILAQRHCEGKGEEIEHRAMRGQSGLMVQQMISKAEANEEAEAQRLRWQSRRPSVEGP